MRVFPDEIGSTYEEVMQEGKKYFDHKEKLEAFCGSTLILHTKNDSLVSSSNAALLYKWANEPKELEIFAKGDHNNILPVNQAVYLDIIMDFTESLQ